MGPMGPSAPGWGRQHHSQRDPPFVPSKRLPDWASLELSPSVESCRCGLGPSPVRLGPTLLLLPEQVMETLWPRDPDTEDG